jgi:hypothetical protein
MSKKTILAAGTSPFAHLLGGAAALAGRALGRKGAEEDNIDPDAEAEEDETDVDEDGNPKKAKGETDDPDADDDDEVDPDAENDDEDPDAEDDEPEPKGKKAVGFDRGYSAANKRARAIFASPAAAGRPDLAAQLAFETKMTSAEAIGVLGMAGASAPKRGRSLDERMGARREARPGTGTGAAGEQSFADQVTAASKKAGRRK